MKLNLVLERKVKGRSRDVFSKEQISQAFSYSPLTGEFVPLSQGASITRATGYVILRIGKKTALAHRVAWLLVYGSYPENILDHANGVRDDNRIANLRVANKALNGANTGLYKNNTSGIKGVSFKKSSRKWVASIGKSRTHLGYFDDKESAAEAYAKAAKDRYGEFSNPINNLI